MKKGIFKKINNYNDLRNAFQIIDTAYNPPLSKRLNNYDDYIKKLFLYANNFLYLYNGEIAGLICFYDNNVNSQIIYITQISIARSLQGKNLGNQMIEFVENIGKRNNMRFIRLEVKKDNIYAIKFYKKCGFTIDKHESKKSYFMSKTIT